MLSLTTKKYEVEEKVQLTQIKKGMEEEYQKLINEKKEKEAAELLEIIYEFDMQITSNEMARIKEILIDEAYKNSKIKDEDKLYEKTLKLQEEFNDICFKEHKEEFKKINEYKFLEMVDLIYDFFMNMFIEKRVQQANTMNTHLKKIGNN